MSLNPILASYIPVAEGIARTFGEFCEVVLHDWSKPESSVVAIFNGHVTNREEKAPTTSLGLKLLKQSYLGKDIFLNYRNNEIPNKIIKSTSIAIRDEKGKPIGFLCINLDVTHMMLSRSTLEGIVSMGDPSTNESNEDEQFFETIPDMMEKIIQKASDKIGKPPAIMQKDEKIAFVRMLDESGLFCIKGSVQHIAKMLGLSKYTIYSYLESPEKL